MTAWTTPAASTPGHDAQTATLIGAVPTRLATFNDRVIATVAAQQAAKSATIRRSA